MIVTKDLRVDVLGEAIFQKVNVVIRSGERVGVMGSNERDVSLFLQVLAGEVEMDEGTVATEGERVVYMSSKMLSGNPETLDELLTTRPSCIILDALEPTPPNTSEKIQNALESFRGSVVIASNDASLMLRAKITRMLELHTSTKSLTSFTANYTDYLVEREKNEARVTEAYKKQQKEKKRLEDWLDQKRKEASIDRSPQKGSTIRTKAKYLKREILDKEIPRPSHLEE